MYTTLLTNHHNNYVLIIFVDQSHKSSPDNKYVGQVVYEIKRHDSEWLMRFMVAKHLNALLEVSNTSIYYKHLDLFS